jgi:drug/metabolite transporter (DMT)-like permease
MHSTASCIATLVVMNLFWAGSYAVMKYGLGEMDPIVLVFWRFVMGLVVLSTWIAIKRKSLALDRNDVARIAFAGLVLAASSFLIVTGIEMSYATDASLLYAFEPVWGILLASLILRERFLFTTGIGLALILAGLLALSGFDLKAIAGIGDGGVGLGNALIVIGLLSESLFTIVLKPVAKKRDASVVIAVVLVTAIVALAVPLTMRGKIAMPLDGASVFSIAYLSIICTAIGYTSWVAITRHVPVNVMLFTIFIQPIAGMFIASAALDEALDVRLIVGGSFLLAGMATAVFGHFRAERGAGPAAQEEPVAISP